MATDSATLLFQKNASDQKAKTELKTAKEQELLSSIGTEVDKIFRFGANNWTKSKKVNKALICIVDLVGGLISPEFNFVKALPEEYFPKEEREKHAVAKRMLGTVEKQFIQKPGQSKENWTIFGIQAWNKTAMYDYMLYYPMTGQAVMNPKVLPVIFRYLRDNIKQNKHLSCFQEHWDIVTAKENFEALQSAVAPFLLKWMKQTPKGYELFFAKEHLENIELGQKFLFTNEQEPQDVSHREAVMRYIEKDVHHGAFNFGTGNCALMADCAFLLAIQRVQNTAIRYVRFKHRKGKVEELNAIVIGPWPQAGCWILTPWNQNSLFKWEGSCEKTDSISAHNQAKVLFTIEDETERQTWVKLLADLKFDPETLIQNPNRQQYANYILKICQKICDTYNKDNKDNKDAAPEQPKKTSTP